MSISISHIVGAILIGIGATILLDLWTLVLAKAFKVAPLNFCVVGRWVRCMASGTFRHASIAATPPQRAECAIGWITHYLVGVVFAFVFVAIVSGRWLAQPTIGPAVLFGFLTVLVPFLVMQPLMGFGVAAARTPKPKQARIKSAVTHTVFGLGLYLTALPVSYCRHGLS